MPAAAKAEATLEFASLTAALASVQAQALTVVKDKQVNAGPKRYKFADLASVHEVVLPALGAAGLAWLCLPTRTDDGAFVLRYSLRHVSGEMVEGDFPLPDPSVVRDPQAIGSAVTYAKRYAICAVVGIATEEDDDGAAAKQAAERGPRVQDFNEGQRAQRGPIPREEAAHFENPVVTDHVWFEGWREAVLVATDPEVIRAAWPTLKAKHDAREVEDGHYADARALLKERLDSLEAERARESADEASMHAADAEASE